MEPNCVLWNAKWYYYVVYWTITGEFRFQTFLRKYFVSGNFFFWEDLNLNVPISLSSWRKHSTKPVCQFSGAIPYPPNIAYLYFYKYISTPNLHRTILYSNFPPHFLWFLKSPVFKPLCPQDSVVPKKNNQHFSGHQLLLLHLLTCISVHLTMCYAHHYNILRN